ncbi:VRR-NUC domain-containing protein [Bacterioplanes sanyensis]|uniref:phosphodiesterase I n=1 Tax=Bacterioplanes sanyensis TaxID=1249553 RepID=A0A222FIW0_9GAMM|nr:VRR-NUC domain-containing protein [Bacterioplanes sanyensis]ASP38975.1 VRR-NUC domain-containing protein [Bacterioplanes sanyensis]
MLSPAALQLSPTYYRDNFQQLANQAQRLYHDLLTQQERHWLAAYQRLPLAAQCLYVRLLSRKGQWFRRDKLHYDEIDEIDTAAQQLQEAGLIDIVTLKEIAADDSKLHTFNTQPSELLALFTKAELGQCLSVAGWRTMKREPLLQLVQQQWPENIEKLTHAPLFWVCSQDFLELLQLLFFGHLQQSLTDFVLSDLGIYRYEQYELSTAQRLFQQRQQLEAHWQFERWRQDLPELKSLSADALQDLLDSLPHAVDTTMARRVERIRLQLARQLERCGEATAALSYYQQCQRHPARERRLRILHQQKDPQRLELAQQMIEAPWSEEERVFTQRFVARMKSDPLAKMLEPAADISQQQLLLDEQGNTLWRERGVEFAALQSYVDEHGGSGFYIENTLFTAVFALTFWPVLFAAVPGAFFHPFQQRAADLYEADFRSRRQDIVAECEAVWQAGPDDWWSQLQQTWQEKNGLANPLLHWPALESCWQELLPLAVQRIPTAHWRSTFDFLWQDIRRHRSGMPDLIVFPPQGGYRLLEVKGPGDTLQPNQRAWFAQFARHDIPAMVLQVRSS